MKVVVTVKGENESIERGSVHDKKNTTENIASGNTIVEDVQGREVTRKESVIRRI